MPAAGEEDDAAVGPILRLAVDLRELKQRRDGNGILRARRETRHDRDRVVVGLDDHGLAGKLRIAALEDADYVAVRPGAPLDIARYGAVRAFAGGRNDGLCIVAGDPEARDIDRHSQPLDLRFAAGGVLRLDHKDGGAVEQRGVEPALPGVEVHHDDGVLRIQSVEVREGAVSDVDDGTGEALAGDCAGADEVRPQPVEFVACAAHFKGGVLMQRCRKVELLHHSLHAKLFESVDDVVRGLGVAGVARNARAEGRHRIDMRAEPVRRYLVGEFTCRKGAPAADCSRQRHDRAQRENREQATDRGSPARECHLLYFLLIRPTGCPPQLGGCAAYAGISRSGPRSDGTSR